MKKQLFSLLTVALLSTFFITSCTEDNPLGTLPGIGPSISLSSASGFISSSAVVLEGEIMNFRVTANTGDEPLDRLTITENGSNVALTRISYESGSNFGANPAPVLNATDKQGFTLDIMIEAPGTAGNYEYAFVVRDEASMTASATATVTVEMAPVETAIDTTFSAVLVYNRDGQEFGGLNLYNGEAVAFNSMDAQIRDLGIDLNLPSADNWLQQITAVNDAELKAPGDSQPEGFSFETTNTREALIAAFDNGVAITNSEKVAVGDIFLVKNNDDYFILQVTEVTVTAGDNNDYYEFSIKKSEGA